MITQARASDIPEMEAFLAAHADTSMFLRSNLDGFGVGMGTHRRSTDFYLWCVGDAIAGVFGITRSGNLMAQAPGAPAEVTAAFARAIAGRRVEAMTGPPQIVRAVLAACGLNGAPFALQHDEPLYRLDLACLGDPGRHIRRPATADLPILTEWFAAYMAETASAPPEGAHALAQMRAEEAVAGNSVRVLDDGGTPAAMAALNAAVADYVQVGGVFVPPARRGRGLGAAVTAALLRELREEEGARVAILFAATPAAARVYEQIGFIRVGTYRVAILRAPAPVVPQ